MMNSISLLRVVKDGEPDKHYANGRRITRARYNEIFDTAERKDSFQTIQKESGWYHYAEARMSLPHAS